MAKNLATDEDYIDMELNSIPHCREFEFQMSSESAVFPADELFYKGKLLPLHLPPRLQMVQNLLHTAAAAAAGEEDDFYNYTMPFLPTCSTAPCTNSNTPLGSCNISPSESCRVSCELNPDDCFFEWSADLSTLVVNGNIHPRKKSWSKRFKLIKRYGQKLKASRTYLKSLFTKSAACSDDQSSSAKVVVTSNEYAEVSKKNSIGAQNARADSYPITIANIIKNLDKEASDEDHRVVHRTSFSGAIKRRDSPAKCSSLSSSNSSSTGSSLNSNGFHELQLLGRSSSVTEVECSIEAAIEHCKSSQKAMDSRNISRDDSGICCSI